MYGPGQVSLERRSVEAGHRGDERVDVGGEQRDRLRAVAALELVEDVLVLGQRAEPVDGVGREDHGAARAQSGDRVPRSQQELGQGGAERLGLLDVDEVARVRDRDEPCVGQLARRSPPRRPARR